MQWNHSECKSCGYTGETMTFGGQGPKLTCPQCKGLVITYLGYPVIQNGKTEYQPDPDPAQEAKRITPR